MIFVIIVKLR